MGTKDLGSGPASGLGSGPGSGPGSSGFVLPPAGLLAAESAKTTQLGERLVWTAMVLLLIAGIYLLMWRGWRSRGRRQQHLPAPPSPPADLGAVHHGPVEAVYVSTTTAGDWLDRVVAHGLGVRSAAEVTVTEYGVLVERQGATTLWLPAAAIQDARTAAGMAGKFVGENGLVVITWAIRGPDAEQPGTEYLLDTGLRCARQAERAPLLAAIQAVSARTEDAPRGHA